MTDRALAETAGRVARWYQAALDAVAPDAAVRRHLRRHARDLIVDGRRVSVNGRLVVIAVGKAAVGMARATAEICGELVQDGLVLTKDDHVAGASLTRLPVFEAGHPIPDDRGQRATRQALSLVSTLGEEDVVLALISGGGSALLEAPRPPVTLGELAMTTDLLLRAGAPIGDLNLVRTALSLVKGGGLRRTAPRATFVTLILSDVLGNDPRVIASGPTVPGRSAVDGRAVLERYGVMSQVPMSVSAAMSGAANGDLMPAENAERDVVAIVGDNATTVSALAAAIRRDGLRVDVPWSNREGEARTLAEEWIERCLATPDGIDAIVGGGEATVTVRGDGLGGRNTEFALAAALLLAEREMDDWAVASLATDGQDGLTGVAGAIADAQTVERARRAGVDAVLALEQNDSYHIFAAGGGLVRPGPTGTNVNDLYLAVRQAAIAG